MPDPKPYNMPDFQMEKELATRSDKRLRELAKIALDQQKTLRRKCDDLKRDYQAQIRQLQAEHQAALEQAKQQAFEEGRQAGLEDGREEVEKALQSLSEYRKRLEESEKEFLRNAERHVVTLAMAIARKIIGREAKSDREIVLHTVKEALKRTADKSGVTVHVNPEELDYILSRRKQLQDVDRDLADMKFVPDENVSPGGCVVHTRIGDIDGRIESQIEEIEEGFKRE